MVTWDNIVDNFTGNEEKCLLSLLKNGHDNCFSSQTIKEAKLEGFSINEINSVVKKLEEKGLCHKIPRSLFSIIWGWLYEADFSVIVAWGFYIHGKKAVS